MSDKLAEDNGLFFKGLNIGKDQSEVDSQLIKLNSLLPSF